MAALPLWNAKALCFAQDAERVSLASIHQAHRADYAEYAGWERGRSQHPYGLSQGGVITRREVGNELCFLRSLPA
jgi:hypothetical protein